MDFAGPPVSTVGRSRIAECKRCRAMAITFIVGGTPTFFVDGEQVRLRRDDLRDAIENALR